MDRPHFARDPIYGGPLPSIPRANRRALKIVWPRDKKQTGPHSWRRWKDLFTNKGPDMWLSSQSYPAVDRPVWSGWNQEGRDNLGYNYRNDNQVRPPRWAYRPEWQRYDFNKRKYRMPDAGTWSDVKWSRRGRRPLYIRDPWGFEWVSAEYRQADRPDFNPFAWHHDTPYWDWHYDGN